MDKLKEECGVFGFYNNDDYDTAEMIYYGLPSMTMVKLSNIKKWV